MGVVAVVDKNAVDRSDDDGRSDEVVSVNETESEIVKVRRFDPDGDGGGDDGDDDGCVVFLSLDRDCSHTQID